MANCSAISRIAAGTIVALDRSSVVGGASKPNSRLPPASQAGDVYADIAVTTRDLDFAPRSQLEDGIARFVAWFRRYTGR